MKQSDIEPCVGCNKGVAHTRAITFYVLRIGYRAINLPVVQRQTGLEMMLGNAAIASVMGPDEDIAIALGDDRNVLVCLDCAMRMPIAEIAEIANQEPPEREPAS